MSLLDDQEYFNDFIVNVIFGQHVFFMLLNSLCLLTNSDSPIFNLIIRLSLEVVDFKSIGSPISSKGVVLFPR